MGLRFRRRLKIIPGLWLNISKSGISTSVGKPGATVNFKGGRVRGTVGLPGTGLSYRTDLSDRPTVGQPRQSPRTGSLARVLFGVALLIAILAVVLAALGR